MKLTTLHIFTAFLLFAVQSAYSQNKSIQSLQIGDTVKNVPSFKNLINYPVKKLNLNDLRGKIVILDFWSTGCPSCIESIPYLEKLQVKFPGKLQIILVNAWETRDKIEDRVSKMKILRPGIGLTSLPNVYGDTVWRKIFPHVGLPHHVWINQNGKVIATTHMTNLTPEHIQQVLDRKDIHLSIKEDLMLRGYDVRSSGLIAPGDTSVRPLFYSAFIKYNFGFGGGNKIFIDTSRQIFRRCLFNRSALELYREAFHIPYAEKQRVLLEVNDPGALLRPTDNNQKDKFALENCFSYELSIPLSQKDSMYSYMIQDFNRFFSVEKKINARMEQRKYPCYVLKKVNDNILTQLASSDKDTVIETSTSYYHRNRRYDGIRWYLKDNIENLSKSIAFKDETGIRDEALVSLDLPKDFTHMPLVKKMLREQGLDLILEDRSIPVLVIKDVAQTQKDRETPL